MIIYGCAVDCGVRVVLQVLQRRQWECLISGVKETAEWCNWSAETSSAAVELSSTCVPNIASSSSSSSSTAHNSKCEQCHAAS